MKRRLLLLVSVLALAVSSVLAQDYKEFMHGTDALYSAWCITETYDGDLLLAVDQYEEDGDMTDHILYRFTREGVLKDSLVLGIRQGESYLLERDPNPGDDASYLFGYTYSGEGGGSVLRLLKLDDDLSVIDTVEVAYSDEGGLYATTILDAYGDIVMYWKSDDKKGNLARVGLDGEIGRHAKFDLYSEKCVVGKNSLNVYDEANMEYAVAYTTKTYYPEPSQVVVVYDSLFNQKESMEMVRYDGLVVEGDYPCLRGYGDRRLLFFRGEDYAGYSGSEVDILELAEVDGLDQVLRRCQVKTPFPETPYHAEDNPFVMAKDGGFYMVATRTEQSNPMHVFKLNPDLTLKWERWCQDPSDPNAGLVCNDMCALEDGGVALCGVKFGIDRQMFWAVSFTDEGTGVGEVSDRVRPYCLLPNPVKDVLSVRVSPDVRLATLELYDAAGRCVARSRTAEMNVAALPAGQYVAKVVLQDGTAYSDKVIKE